MRQGVFHGAVHAQAQGFEADEQLPGVERADGRAEVAQPFHPRPNDEGDVAERPAFAEYIVENQAVVALARLGKLRKLAVAEVVGAAVHNHAAHAGAVPANPLRGRLHHNVRAVLQGPEQVAARAEGVVHNQRQVVLVGNGRNGLKIGNAEAGVANGFEVNGLGIFVDRAPQTKPGCRHRQSALQCPGA